MLEIIFYLGKAFADLMPFFPTYQNSWFDSVKKDQIYKPEWIKKDLIPRGLQFKFEVSKKDISKKLSTNIKNEIHNLNNDTLFVNSWIFFKRLSRKNITWNIDDASKCY